jgi:death-on-curing family protein
MTKRRVTVRELAVKAGLDLDEALVTLWDAGIDSVLLPDDRIAAHELGAARRALDVPTNREEVSVSYWVNQSGLEREQFTRQASDAGIAISSTARNVPRGSLRKLRRMFGTPTPAPEVAPSLHTRIVLPPLRWEIVGNPTECKYLLEEQVIAIHAALVEDFRHSPDPIFPEGVKSHHLLSTALSRPQTGLGSERKYPTIEMAGAALLHSIVHNHAFHNGNKRTGLVSLLVFLDQHGMVLTCDQDELFRFLLKVGQHSVVPMWADQLPDREVMEISRWIRSWSRPIVQGERPLSWIKLKQRLRAFGCTWEPASGAGNRINLYRDVQVKGRLRVRTVTLNCQAGWAGDGTEADRRTIHHIRSSLHLDDLHNIDTTTFFGGTEIDEFILQYRRILRRLGKF